MNKNLSELKSDWQPNDWHKIQANIILPLDLIAESPAPLFYAQKGNMLFVRIGDNSYIFEVNL